MLYMQELSHTTTHIRADTSPSKATASLREAWLDEEDLDESELEEA